jgi:hypothetical protein
MTELSLKLDQATIDGMVKDTVRAQVALALGQHSDRLITSIAEEVLFRKVDYQGKTPSYNHSSDTTFLMYHVKQALESAVRESITEWVKDQKTVLRATVYKVLKAKPTALVEKMVDAIASGFDGWRISINLKSD